MKLRRCDVDQRSSCKAICANTEMLHQSLNLPWNGRIRLRRLFHSPNGRANPPPFRKLIAQ
eukprot:6475092-Amphidinium_carterae.2